MSIPEYKPKHATRDYRQKNSYRRGYNKTWAKVRKTYLIHHPICSHPDCKELATQVDHKKRLEEGGAKYDWNNLQGFCATHHSQKTVREDGGFGRAKISHD